MRPTPSARHLIAVAIFAAVSALAGYLAFCDPDLSDSQISIATAALKRHAPELFPNDAVFGPNGLWRFHTPAVQGLLELVLVPTDFEDPILPFRMLTGVAVMVYLCAMYALLYRQCRSWSVSAYVAIFSSTVTFALGRAYWGVGSLASITPPTLCLVLTPLVCLAILSYSGRWRRLLVFGFVGLMGNFHIVTAMNLTLVLAIAHLGRHRFRLSAWVSAIGGGLAATVGAMPFILYYYGLRQSAPTDPQVDAEMVREAFRIGHLAVLYPEMLKDLVNWLLAIGALLVPAAAVVLRMERFRARHMRFWVWFAIGGIVVAFGLHGASQLLGRLGGEAPPVIDFVRASSLIMLPLYVFFAEALTQLFRVVRRHHGLIQWACAAALVVWMVPSDNLRVPRHAFYRAAAALMPEEDKPRRVQKLRERAERRNEMKAIANWARNRTDNQAVFLADSTTFRMHSRRSLVAASEDVRIIYYLEPAALRSWSRQLHRQNGLICPAGVALDAEGIRRFVGELAGLPQFQRASQWYMIVPADRALRTTQAMDSVVSPEWGRYYGVWRIR